MLTRRVSIGLLALGLLFTSACNNIGGLLGGLPGLGGALPPVNAVRVQVINDTSFEVDPRIRYTEGTGFFSGLFGARSLDTGTLMPGDALSLDISCDSLGRIYSQSAGQFLGDQTVGQARTTRDLVRDSDFKCRDTITFTFLGDGPAFGVVVAINGLIVE